jgi:DNA-binding NtrC family response regulator
MIRQFAMFPSEVEEMALMLAITDQLLLIWGEPGTGKEFLARFIHRRSFRAEHPFAITGLDDLSWNIAPVMESSRRWRGPALRSSLPDRRLLEANGGTLCISGVDDENLWSQGMLLSFLENPVLRDLTGQEFRLDVRIILLSDRSLLEGVQEKWFREDLYYRLSGFALHLRPLRERREEMRQIILSLLSALKTRLVTEEIESLDDREMELLCRYHWPGNLRELQSLLAEVEFCGGGKRNLERWVQSRLG